LLKSLRSLKLSIFTALLLIAVLVIFAPNSNSQEIKSDSEINKSNINIEDLSLLNSLKQSKFRGDWKIDLGSYSFEEDTDDAKSVRIGVSARPSYILTEELVLKGDFRFNAESGRVQTRFEQGSDRFLNVNNATIEFLPSLKIIPNSRLHLEGGILNQSYLSQELLFSSQRSFAGLKLGASFEKEKVKANIFAENVLPSSTSLNTERIEKEEMPEFQAQSISLNYNDNKFVNVDVGGLLFQYSKLPSKVAYQSLITGNSVVGDDPSNSKFYYNFKGYGLNSRFDLKLLENINLIGNIQMLENSEAVSGNNRGQIVWVGPVVKVGDIKMAFNYGQFFSEPDVVPSYYMSLLYGGTNRQGSFGRLEIEFSELNFKILGQYIDADVINPRVHQLPRTNYVVRLETLYVSF
jgi:hypothetical protein